MVRSSSVYAVAIVIIALILIGAFLVSNSPSKTTPITGVNNSSSNSSSGFPPITGVNGTNSSNISSNSSNVSGNDVMLQNSTQLGTFLADSRGMTLYMFKSDTVGNSSTQPVSACTGACLNIWPVFNVTVTNVQSHLNATAFTTFTRSDGLTQTAYNGTPLYYYSGDTSPGQTNGQGINNLWFVVKVNSTANSTTY